MSSRSPQPRPRPRPATPLSVRPCYLPGMMISRPCTRDVKRSASVCPQHNRGRLLMVVAAAGRVLVRKHKYRFLIQIRNVKFISNGTSLTFQTSTIFSTVTQNLRERTLCCLGRKKCIHSLNLFLINPYLLQAIMHQVPEEMAEDRSQPGRGRHVP